MVGSEEERGGIQCLRRAVAIMRLLAEMPAGLSLAAIATRLDLPRSTVQRIIAALEADAMVQPAGPGGGTRLGPTIARLAEGLNGGLKAVLRQEMTRLRDETGETVTLACLQGDTPVVIDAACSPQELRVFVEPGTVLELHSSASGKALLALLTPAMRDAALPRSLHAATPATIVSAAALHDEIEAVRRSRIAYDREEHAAGVCAIGTPLAAAGDGRPQGYALTVVLPTERFREREPALKAALLALHPRIAGAA